MTDTPTPDPAEGQTPPADVGVLPGGDINPDVVASGGPDPDATADEAVPDAPPSDHDRIVALEQRVFGPGYQP